MQLKELDYELMNLGVLMDDEDIFVNIDGRNINLMLDMEKEYLYAYAAVCRVEAGIDSETLRSLLELNNMGKKTEGGQLGLIKDRGILLYSKRFRIEALTSGTLDVEFKTIAQTVAKLVNLTDVIIGKASIEFASTEEVSDDALSVTNAVSYGWIKA